MCAQGFPSLYRIGLTHDYRHSNAHIENLIHFGAVDVSLLGDEFEDRCYAPAARLDYRIAIFRKDAGQIINQTSPGDMREPANHRSRDLGQQRLIIFMHT